MRPLATARPDGLDEHSARSIAAAVAESARFNKQRSDVSLALLAEYGRHIAPNINWNVAARFRTAALILAHGLTSDGDDYFDFQTGRMTISDVGGSFVDAATNAVYTVDFTDSPVRPGGFAFAPLEGIDAGFGDERATSSAAIAGRQRAHTIIERSTLLLVAIPSAATIIVSLTVIFSVIFLARTPRAKAIAMLVWAAVILPISICGGIATVSLLRHLAKVSELHRAAIGLAPAIDVPHAAMMAQLWGGFQSLVAASIPLIVGVWATGLLKRSKSSSPAAPPRFDH